MQFEVFYKKNEFDKCKDQIKLAFQFCYNISISKTKYKGTVKDQLDLKVRKLEHVYLKEADKIHRLAFGTFIGIEKPMSFFGDSDIVKTRFATNLGSSFAIEVNGKLAGSFLVTYWEGVGFFGPISNRPIWNKSIFEHLMRPMYEKLPQPEIRYAGLFTFAGVQKI